MTQQRLGLIASVEASMRRFDMLTCGDKVLVAVSGGPDSVALLHVLATIAEDWKLHLHVAHLNHGIRKKEAADEAAFVEKLSTSLGIPCETGFEDVTAFSKKCGLSLQEGARKVRYRFLRSVAKRVGSTKIALGHHADDNAESVLMNLLRGAGPRGLAGIPPVRNNLFIRPLIEIPREKIMSFLHQRKLAFKTDASNQDPTYLRNRIRHELLPFLAERFSTHGVTTLNRLASLMRTDESYWQQMVENAFESLALKKESNEVVLPIPELDALHPALSQRLIRYVLARLAGTLKRFRMDHVIAVLTMAQSPRPSGMLYLAQGISVRRDRDQLILRVGEPPAIAPFEYRVEKLENVIIPEIDTELRLSTCAFQDIKARIKSTPRTSAFFDMEKLSFPLVIRNFRHGDRFVPLGMTGTQKVKDFFINEKVARAKRMACPLLVQKGNVIWIGGYRISDQVKTTEDTETVLQADLVPLKDPSKDL
jgi:tRNA(Ile)-lysidine synthase